ncbi:unnamed protein product [Cuscuta epithymum]|uniref:Uncharacterized protein n=1 Tax=Cuscuta epithymum TaxID=186058 RepID=A0AAV0F5F6_9ASTE|nr:unnamed protein product [Cuscuta epithymum]
MAASAQVESIPTIGTENVPVDVEVNTTSEAPREEDVAPLIELETPQDDQEEAEDSKEVVDSEAEETESTDTDEANSEETVAEEEESHADETVVEEETVVAPTATA